MMLMIVQLLILNQKSKMEIQITKSENSSIYDYFLGFFLDFFGFFAPAAQNRDRD